MTAPLIIRDFKIYPEFLTLPEQRSLVDELRTAAAETPPFQPVLRGGKRMSVKITSFGDRGWTPDEHGYGYAAHHPNGMPWPPIPKSVMRIWEAVSEVTKPPDSCLMNFYSDAAKMGMHQDKDEAGLEWPVVSISLGDEALFRMGNVERGGKTETIWLRSGDVVVMGGAARLAHHGIDRIRFGSSTLLKQGGRLNLTLRVAA